MEEKSSFLKDNKLILLLCVIIMIFGFYLSIRTGSRILSLVFFAICPLLHLVFMRDHHKH